MNRASHLSMTIRGNKGNKMSEAQVRIMALVPPPLFWQALLVIMQESVVFHDADRIGHSASALWGISVKDSVEVVERILDEAIRGGMLSLGQTVV